jgi:hypothetical protein
MRRALLVSGTTAETNLVSSADLLLAGLLNGEEAWLRFLRDIC